VNCFSGEKNNKR